MKTITIQVTEEQEKMILEALGQSTHGKWVPAPGEEYWYVNALGQVCKTNNDSNNNLNSGDKDIISQNNHFKTEEQAKRESLRRQGAERRYLPKDGEKYKTFNPFWTVTLTTWAYDGLDWFRYHTGRVWHKDTPDAEIQAWIDTYKDAWCHE